MASRESRGGNLRRMVAEPVGVGRLLADRYRLLSQLGRGGMGTVWLATDAVLGRQVAIKEVTFAAAAPEERRLLRERTLREARAAARFEHPRVTTVHDVVETDGMPWIVMEYVPSRTLTQVIRDLGPMPPHLVARIGMDLLGALQAAHRAGIVHRDVKPDNVLVDSEWRAWLTDFGIATSSGDSGLTQRGVLLGSPSYMSPERARNEDPGPPADMWSLGATLFTAVEGRPPFDRGAPMPTLIAVLSEPPAPMVAAGALSPVLSGCLTKDPARRMTAEHVRPALQAAMVEPPPSAIRQATAPQWLPAENQRRPDVEHENHRGPDVEQMDLAELSSLAKATASALAGKAARKAARKAVGSASARLSGRPSRHAERDLPVPPPATTPAPSHAAEKRPKWRFRRRWVVVPLAIVVVVIALVIAVLLYLFGALDGAL